MNLFSKYLACCSLLLANLAPSDLAAQESDHLSMRLAFQDSILQVQASYKSGNVIEGGRAYFMLNPGFEIDTMVSRGLLSYALVQREDIPFPLWELRFEDVSDTAKLEVAFTYRIDLKRQNHLRSDWIELNADKMWFPNRDKMNNAFSYDIAIWDFPDNYQLITHTDATVSRIGNQIYIKKEAPWYEVLLLAGKAMKTQKYTEAIQLIGNREIPDSSYHSIGSKVANSIGVLNSYFGKTDTIGSFRVVLRNTSREELGFQFNRRNLIVTGTDFNDYGNLAHEIAHYWWSDANFIQEPWLNESFANFGMYLVLRKFEPGKYKRLLTKHAEIAEKAIPLDDASLFAENAYPSYYYKGAILLTRLEEKIGEQDMKRLLNTYLSSDERTTQRFLDLLEAQSGRQIRTFLKNMMAQ